MKKVLVAFALFAGLALFSSCGGAERCPAYTDVSPVEEGRV